MFFAHNKCDQGVVSDSKTIPVPCCSRQQLRDCDTPWTQSKTTVDLSSASGCLLGAVLAVVIFCTKEEGSVRNKYR